MTFSLSSYYLGRVPYRAALDLQLDIVGLMKSMTNKSTHSILLLEHQPVYTIGVRQKDPTNDLSATAIQNLRDLGAEFIKTNRGGLITYHGPGQLVAYILANMRSPALRGRGLRWYVGALADAGVQVCKRLGVTQASTGPDHEIGVWINDCRKVMAIGIHQSFSIVYHGIAINCTQQPLEWLDRVTPCGLVGKSMTCLSDELGYRQVTPRQIAPLMADCLAQSLFKAESIAFNSVDHWSIDDDLEPTSPRPDWSQVRQYILEDVQQRGGIVKGFQLPSDAS